MGLFGLLNYEDYILRTMVKSNYARNTLTIFLIYIITAMIRFHLAIVICYIFTWDNYLDLIFPIAVTVCLSSTSNIMFKYVETHKPLCERGVDYLMENYSQVNLIRWKRFLLLIMSVYVLTALSFINIDNYFILITTLQTVCSFIISDILDNKILYIWYDKLKDRLTPPKVTKSGEIQTIIENYIPEKPNKEEIDSELLYLEKVSAPPIKPPTPPMIRNGELKNY